MYSRKLICLVFVVSVSLVGVARASTWDGGGVGDLWTTPANWSSDTYPTGGASALVWDGSVDQPLIDSTVTASHPKVRVGDTQTGCSITMTGGSLTANSTANGFMLGSGSTGGGALYMSGDSVVVAAKGTYVGFSGDGTITMSGTSSITNGTYGMPLGYNASGTGSLTMSDNSSIFVSATQNFMVGGKGYGSLDMTGSPSISIGKMYVGWSGGTGDVQFDGGTIHSAGYAGAFSMQPGSQMDITGGVMTIDDPDGSRVALMEGYVTGSQLSGYGFYDLSHVIISWDEDNELTTISAVPEPATICMLGLGGLTLLRRKRV